MTWVSKDALSIVFRRSIEQVSYIDANATRFLHKATGTAIAKLETEADGKNGRRNRRRLLLSLKLRDSAIGEAAC